MTEDSHHEKGAAEVIVGALKAQGGTIRAR